MEELRIFYKDNQIIWTYGLEGNGVFPTTIEEDLQELPEGTACITLTEQAEIDAFMASDDNTILDGALIIGEPRDEPPPPDPPRDLAAEIDAIIETFGADAVSAMGEKADDNPLHHDRAEEWGATEHVAIGNGAPHHTPYTHPSSGSCPQTPKVHTLASHSTKPHSALSDAPADAHHPQSHNAASHSDIASTGAAIDDAVAKKHATAHTLASHSTKSHGELTGITQGQHHDKFTPTEHTAIGDGAPHHAKYTDAAAKAAAVQSGVIINGVTKAPTHDAVYDVKTTADGAIAKSLLTTLGDIIRRGAAVAERLAIGSNGKVLTVVSGQPAWATPAASGAGEGHITILCPSYDSIGAGTWVLSASGLYVIGTIYNSTNANLDNISYKAYLQAGTYTLCFFYVKGTVMAIVDIDIDAAEVGSVDCYRSLVLYNQTYKVTGITIPTSGLKTIKIRTHGKHASSGAYRAQFSYVALWRTA